MAKKVVSSLSDQSGVKYAKLIKSVKSEKTGAYVFKEEIVIEDYVKDILAGKTQQEVIDELRAKEKEAEKAKLEAAAEAPKEDAPKEEESAAEAPKEETPEEEDSKKQILSILKCHFYQTLNQKLIFQSGNLIQNSTFALQILNHQILNIYYQSVLKMKKSFGMI